MKSTLSARIVFAGCRLYGVNTNNLCVYPAELAGHTFAFLQRIPKSDAQMIGVRGTPSSRLWQEGGKMDFVQTAKVTICTERRRKNLE